MRVPGLQKGGAPWRGEWGKLGEEKQILWLRPSVPELTLCSFLPLPPWDLGQSPVCNKGTRWWAERKRAEAGHIDRTPQSLCVCMGRGAGEIKV